MPFNNDDVLSYFSEEKFLNLRHMIKENMDNEKSKNEVLELLAFVTKKNGDDDNLCNNIYHAVNENKIDDNIESLTGIEYLLDFVKSSDNPIRELNRVEYNITNYNTFLCIMSYVLTKDKYFKKKIDDNSEEFNLSIATFIMGIQYDIYINNDSSEEISDDHFSNEVIHSLHYTNETMQGQTPNKSIVTVLRNAISHGEYYLFEKQGTKYLKIENSGKNGPFLEMEISLDEFMKFAKDTYLEKFKESYPQFSFLSSILEQEKGTISETIEQYSKDDVVSSMLGLQAYNVIEYNTQHHLKKLVDLDEKIDCSIFSILSSTSEEMTAYKVLENIKNAIGHGNILFNKETNEIIFNNINPHRDPPEWVATIKANLNDLANFFSNDSLYRSVTETSYENGLPINNIDCNSNKKI